MAAYRILNQAPQYLLASGKVNSGGRLYFYETDLSTPRDTWSDPDLTVLNSNPVLMDSAGRTLTDVWGDDEYGVVMTDLLGVTIWTRNNVQAAGDTAGNQLPVLGVGQFITSDGSQLIATDIIQVPDPTGQTGDILYSDGVLPYWAPPPEIPEPPEPSIVITANSVKIGDGSGSNFSLEQSGTGSAAATGNKATTATVEYDQAYAATPKVIITTTCGYVTSANTVQPTISVTNSSVTGFTVQFSTQTGEGNSDNNIISPVTFEWIAKGRTTT